MNKYSAILIVSLASLSSSVSFAGAPGAPGGGGMMIHDEPGRAEWEERQRQEAARRQAEIAAAEINRIKEREAARVKIEADNILIKMRNDKIALDLENQRRALQARREELEAQRLAGSLQANQISSAEVLRMFRDPEVTVEAKEYWATMLLVLDSTNEEAKTFLRTVRGWTSEEIAGLNVGL